MKNVSETILPVSIYYLFDSTFWPALATTVFTDLKLFLAIRFAFRAISSFRVLINASA